MGEGAPGESRRGSDSSDERQSDHRDVEDSESQSSLGDAANEDEVLIKQLKDEIIARDREILELTQKLEARNKEILNLRSGGGGGFSFSGTEGRGDHGRARTASSVKIVASMKGTLQVSRAAFLEKVTALDATFKEALAALDHTRTSLSNATMTLESESGPKNKWTPSEKQ